MLFNFLLKVRLFNTYNNNREFPIIINYIFCTGIKILTQHRLPASRERWVTTACLYDDVMICGDRMGSIFVYKLAVNYLDPIQSFKKIHGRLGVQSCIIVKDNLLTSGRDGKLRFYNIYKVDSDSPKIEYIYSKNMPMDWVSKVLKYQNDYYVLGFKEVINTFKNIIIVILNMMDDFLFCFLG